MANKKPSQLTTEITAPANGDILVIERVSDGVVGKIQISNLPQTDISGKADLVGGLVPSNQLPSFVDDILEYANLAALPVTGEAGKIYVTLDTNITYRWSGSAYVEISASLALGETSGTAYRGDRGKTAYDHSQTAHNYAPALGADDNYVTDAEKSKLAGIEAGANNYTHPSSHPVSILSDPINLQQIFYADSQEEEDTLFATYWRADFPIIVIRTDTGTTTVYPQSMTVQSEITEPVVTIPGVVSPNSMTVQTEITSPTVTPWAQVVPDSMTVQSEITEPVVSIPGGGGDTYNFDGEAGSAPDPYFTVVKTSGATGALDGSGNLEEMSPNQNDAVIVYRTNAFSRSDVKKYRRKFQYVSGTPAITDTVVFAAMGGQSAGPALEWQAEYKGLWFNYGSGYKINLLYYTGSGHVFWDVTSSEWTASSPATLAQLTEDTWYWTEIESDGTQFRCALYEADGTTPIFQTSWVNWSEVNNPTNQWILWGESSDQWNTMHTKTNQYVEI